MPRTDLNVRALTAGDAPRLALLDRALFGPESWSEDSFRDELTSPFRRYLGIEEEGRVVAVAGILLGPTAEVLTVGTEEAFQRRGYARHLLGLLLAEVRELGSTEVFLEVRADDGGAVALYEGFGFQPVTIRRGYYQASGKDALVMRLDLARDEAVS